MEMHNLLNKLEVHYSSSDHGRVIKRNSTYTRSDNRIVPASSQNANLMKDASGDGRSTDLDNSTTDAEDVAEYKVNKTDSDNEPVSLNPSLEFMKGTIEEILKKFFTNVNDLEIFKNRFNEILSKKHSKEVMDNFVKDVMDYLGALETNSLETNSVGSQTNGSSDENCKYTTVDRETNVSLSEGKSSQTVSLLEAFKNDHFNNETSDNSSANAGRVFEKPLIEEKRSSKITYNVSEMVIKETFGNDFKGSASVDDILKLQEKWTEWDSEEMQHEDFCDIEIPIRNSRPQQDIRASDEFRSCSSQKSQSIMSKVCGYLCKKLKKQLN